MKKSDLDDLETRGMWAAGEPPDPKPRKILIVGWPGAGALMKARELAGESRLWCRRDGARIYAARVAGLAEPSRVCGHLRAPHHSVSTLGLVGQLRRHMWRPGEIALAHGGTLVLDEAPEFRLEALEAVDRAWRAKFIDLYSDQGVNRLTVPTEFDLVLTMTPCPCGWRGEKKRSTLCKCTDRQVAGWFDRIAKIAEGAERIEL